MGAELGSTGATRTGAAADVYDDGRLRVEHDNYYVALAGRPARMPRKEFLLLSRLAQSAGRVVASRELWRHAWPPAAPFNAESLHVHVYRLRRRLAPHGLRIESMVGVGYRLAAAAAASPTPPPRPRPDSARRPAAIHFAFSRRFVYNVSALQVRHRRKRQATADRWRASASFPKRIATSPSSRR